MQNDRPIDDPRLAAALAEVLAVYRQYDLAGAVMLVSAQEAAFAYPLYTTWNIVVEDATLPLGLGFRVREAEQGKARAEALTLGTGHLLYQLRDFGYQTSLWMGDLLRMLRRAGLAFHHRPFNGRRLPRLTGQPPPGGEA